MFTRRTFTGAATALALVLGATGVHAQDELYIPLISKGFQHQFWQAVNQGADTGRRRAWCTRSPSRDPTTKARSTGRWTCWPRRWPTNPAAIGFAALDSQAAIPLLRQAQEAGIAVVAFDSGVDSDIPVATAATDNVAAAALAADKMAELIGGSGQVAVVAHDQTSRTGIDRRDGFVNRMEEAHPDIEVVAVEYGGGDQLESTEITRDPAGRASRSGRHLRHQRRLGHRRGQRCPRERCRETSSSSATTADRRRWTRSARA